MTHKEKQGETPLPKEQRYMQSPGNVPCSICLDSVETAGDRSTARLKCGHHFHLDCIGSAFNAKGAMQCPNCRQVEGGQWLFASGCYLQHHLLRNSNADVDSNNYAGVNFNSTYQYGERVNETSRRPPHGIYQSTPRENDFPLSATRWRAATSFRLLPWNVTLDEIESRSALEMDPPHVSRTSVQSSQAMVMQRAAHPGNFFQATPHIIEGPLSRPRMVDMEPTHLERRYGAYSSRNPLGHEWGSNTHHRQAVGHHSYMHEYNHQAYPSHLLNRALNLPSYDGQLPARVPWT